MHQLTEKRLEKARDILEKYRTTLYENGSFSADTLEWELRDCWNMDYQTLKDLVRDMFKNHPRYKYVAAFYMQHSNTPGPVSEFKPSLATLYNLKMYDCPERDKAVTEFWERFSSNDTKSLRTNIDEARDEWERLDTHGSQSERLKQLIVNVDRLEIQLQELTGEEY